MNLIAQKYFLIGILAVFAGAALFFFRHDIPLFDFLFKTQTNKSGEVTVKVIPQFETEIAFKISMTAPAGELSEDMMRSGVFEDEDGTVHLPTSWNGDPIGGHHREGVLHFGTLSPKPKKVDFILLNIGAIPERGFSWTVPVQ